MQTCPTPPPPPPPQVHRERRRVQARVWAQGFHRGVRPGGGAPPAQGARVCGAVLWVGCRSLPHAHIAPFPPSTRPSVPSHSRTHARAAGCRRMPSTMTRACWPRSWSRSWGRASSPRTSRPGKCGAAPSSPVRWAAGRGGTSVYAGWAPWGCPSLSGVFLHLPRLPALCSSPPPLPPHPTPYRLPQGIPGRLHRHVWQLHRADHCQAGQRGGPR